MHMDPDAIDFHGADMHDAMEQALQVVLRRTAPASSAGGAYLRARPDAQSRICTLDSRLLRTVRS